MAQKTRQTKLFAAEERGSGTLAHRNIFRCVIHISVMIENTSWGSQKSTKKSGNRNLRA